MGHGCLYRAKPHTYIHSIAGHLRLTVKPVLCARRLPAQQACTYAVPGLWCCVLAHVTRPRERTHSIPDIHLTSRRAGCGLRTDAAACICTRLEGASCICACFVCSLPCLRLLVRARIMFSVCALAVSCSLLPCTTYMVWCDHSGQGVRLLVCFVLCGHQNAVCARSDVGLSRMVLVLPPGSHL